MSETTINIIFILIGVFTFCGAWFEWNFFFKSRKAQTIVKLFGMKGAKIFYLVLGIAFFSVGLLDLIGIIDIPLKLGRRRF